jgi:hypothetical protein
LNDSATVTAILENVEYFRQFGAGRNMSAARFGQIAISTFGHSQKPGAISSMLGKKFYSGIDGASDLGPNATGDGCDVSRPRQPALQTCLAE